MERRRIGLLRKGKDGRGRRREEEEEKEEEEEEEVVVKVEVDQGRRARTTWLSRRNWAMQAE